MDDNTKQELATAIIHVASNAISQELYPNISKFTLTDTFECNSCENVTSNYGRVEFEFTVKVKKIK